MAETSASTVAASARAVSAPAGRPGGAQRDARTVLRAEEQASDRALIDGCRTGDPRAWERVLDRYERLVYSIPLSYGLSRDDAADVAQATFLALLNGLGGIREDDRLASWLGTVARRTTWRHIERRTRTSALSLDAGRLDEDADVSAPIDVADEDAGRAVDRLEAALWLDEGMRYLSEPCRELLRLLYLDPTEPSYEEISERIGRPIGAIGPTRARCLKKLRAVMGDAPAGGSSAARTPARSR